MFIWIFCRFVFICIIFVLADMVKIEKLIVPEVVQSGNSSGVVLDCQYTGVGDRFAVQWLYNRTEAPVYQWSPRTEPRVSGILYGRLDLTYRASTLVTEERRALRIVALDPELSGDYTCRVLSDGAEARQTSAMLVFSPEREFALELHQQANNELAVNCVARGLYPQPELIIERSGESFPKQQQRVWRNGALYDAESSAHLRVLEPAVASDREQITCRLQLPQAGYTAIRKRFLHVGKIEGVLSRDDGKTFNNSPSKSTLSIFLLQTVIMCFTRI